MFYDAIFPLFLGISAGSTNAITNQSNCSKNKPLLDGKGLLLLPTGTNIYLVKNTYTSKQKLTIFL
ncbi:hypothetical protein CN341_23275 [Bacillus cereus]|nr:hypothetical protein CN480_19450 [Bacillus cereus]PFF74082.1 hypothetical protein CN341_23275 [Bacillus cereus]